MARYGMGLSKAYILGTTIHKLTAPAGGNLIQNCVDVDHSTPDASRSRCFVAGNATATDSPYNDTIVDLYNICFHPGAGESLSDTALSGDPAATPAPPTPPVYVYSTYP